MGKAIAKREAGILGALDRKRMREALADSLAEGTRRAYKAALALFSTWTAARGIKAEEAGADVIAAYLAARDAEGRAGSTLGKDLAAIVTARAIMGKPLSDADKGQLARVLKGLRKKAGRAGRGTGPRKAARADDIKAMVSALPPGLMGKRDRALLLCGFALMARRGELVALTVENIEPTSGGYYVHVKGGKTDAEGKGFVKFLPSSSGPYSPGKALRAWLDAAGIVSGPIFRRIRKGGHIAAEGMTGQMVARIIHRAAEEAGIAEAEEFAGHSLRRGAITEAAEAGASIYAIMGQSGHKSAQMVSAYVEARDKREAYPLKGII
jgi:integrase